MGEPAAFYVRNLTQEVLIDAGFEPARKTKILVHGWKSDYKTFKPLAQAYLANPETAGINILVLDWSWIASHLAYHSVAESVPLLGDAVGEILGQVMIKDMGAIGDKEHLTSTLRRKVTAAKKATEAKLDMVLVTITAQSKAMDTTSLTALTQCMARRALPPTVATAATASA